MSPLGETLRRARLSKGITFEDAERVTRIPRKYLEALEVENYGILPAPVYARGFLRSYAGYLGLNPADLLPFFPVGHVEEPKLEPLPEMNEPRTWNMNGLIAMAVVGVLILLVIALYSVGREDSGGSFLSAPGGAGTAQENDVIVPPEGAAAGPAQALPELAGQSLQTAIDLVKETGASYVIVGLKQGDVPIDQVIDQSPPAGTAVQPGDTVTIVVSR